MVAVDPATRKRVLRVIIVSLLLDLVSRNSGKGGLFTGISHTCKLDC
jgi:hypothetical protein